MHWRRKWQPTPVFLPGESQGWGSLVGCPLWGCTESDTTEQLHFHFSLLCIREGNGNPFQCSCLENPRDGGAWWAAVYGVAQSRTRLKWLSSSSKCHAIYCNCSALPSQQEKSHRWYIVNVWHHISVKHCLQKHVVYSLQSVLTQSPEFSDSFPRVFSKRLNV